MNILSAIKCLILVQVITTMAMEEIAASNLSAGQKYVQPWTNIEHFKENVLERSDSDRVLWDTPRTLQQSVRSQRGVDGQFGLFLPGLGVVNDYFPAQKEQAPYKRSVVFNEDVINPVSVEISQQPQSQNFGTPSDKTQFVRREGSSPSDNCMKGGMSCKKKCEYKTREPVCEPQLTVRKF